MLQYEEYGQIKKEYKCLGNYTYILHEYKDKCQEYLDIELNELSVVILMFSSYSYKAYLRFDINLI